MEDAPNLNNDNVTSEGIDDLPPRHVKENSGPNREDDKGTDPAVCPNGKHATGEVKPTLVEGGY